MKESGNAIELQLLDHLLFSALQHLDFKPELIRFVVPKKPVL